MNRNSSFDAFMAPSLLEERPSDRTGHIPGRLELIWRKNGASSKWLHYFPIYERAFSRLVGRKPIFLEIGVAQGGSLKTWREYFSRGCRVVGIDNDPRCAEYSNPDGGIDVYIGNQADRHFLELMAGNYGSFDAVLDDGSHDIEHIAASFGYLFQVLKPGGVYVVEDTHATYWNGFSPNPRPISEFVAYLVDAQHAHYPDSNFREFETNKGYSRWPMALGAEIDRIEVYDSVVIVHKASKRPWPEVASPLRQPSEAPENQ